MSAGDVVGGVRSDTGALGSMPTHLPRDRVAIACFVALFLLLFGPKMMAAPIDFLSATALLVVVVLYRRIPVMLRSLDLWLTWVAVVYILIILTATSTPDTWWLFKGPRTLLNYAAVFLLTTVILERYGWRVLLRMFHDAVFLHALIVLTMAFIPAVRLAIESTFGGVTKSVFQISGLTRGLGFTAAVMGFPLVSYSTFNLLSGYRERFIVPKLACILVATLLMGRMGLYLCIAAAFVLVAAAVLRTGRLLKPFGILGMSLLLFWELVRFADAPERSFIGSFSLARRFWLPIRHILEPFVNLVRGRGFTARSLQHLETMPLVVNNSSPFEYLVGTGAYGRGDPFTYLPNDYAYLHMLSAFGIIGIALMLLALAMPLLQYAMQKRGPQYWCFLAVFLIAAVANIKETALFTRHLYTIHVMFVAMLAYRARDAERVSVPAAPLLPTGQFEMRALVHG